MRRDIAQRGPEAHERDTDKGALLIIAFVCVSLCVLAGFVVWVAG